MRKERKREKELREWEAGSNDMRRDERNNTLTDNSGGKGQSQNGSNVLSWRWRYSVSLLASCRLRLGKGWSVWFSGLAFRVEGEERERGFKIQRGGYVGQPSVRIWVRAKRANNVTKPELTGPASILLSLFFLVIYRRRCCVGACPSIPFLYFWEFFFFSRRLRLPSTTRHDATSSASLDVEAFDVSLTD